MNRRAMVIVPLAALATVVLTAVAGGGAGVRLPLPMSVSASAAAHRPNVSSNVGPDAGSSGSTGSGGQTYTTTPPAQLTGCAVSVSNPHPLRGQTAETATVVTAAGAQVHLEADYVRTRSGHGNLADSSGQIAFPLPIDHAPPNVTVRVSATATLRGLHVTCGTSFTPG